MEYDFDDLLKGERADERGNFHYFQKGRLVGTYFPALDLTCKVYPDDVGITTTVKKQLPMVAVYVNPHGVSFSEEYFLSAENLFMKTFWAHCAVNGLIFYADISLGMAGLRNDYVALGAHTTEFDEGSDSHELAKQILLKKLSTEWDLNFLREARKSEQYDFGAFIAKHMS